MRNSPESNTLPRVEELDTAASEPAGMRGGATAAPPMMTLPPLPDSDEELFSLYARTDSDRALREVMRRYQPIILRYFQRNSATKDKAEDLTQDVFVRMVRNRASFDPSRKFSTWSKTITERVAFNAMRAKSRSRIANFTDLRTGSADEEWGFDAPDDEPLPDELAVHRQRRALLDDAIAEVEERYREPLALHYLEGLTHTEAAARLGIPVGTAKSRTHHAIEDLRNILARRGLVAAAL